MSKKISTLIVLSAVLHAAAQKDTSSTRLLDEVVVTANKIEQKQSTTGKVVTVIGKEELQRSAGKSVGQLLNEQAGVWINGSMQATGSVQTVFMRGANAGRTLILMDGIPVNDPSFITSDYDLNMFSINDVERIEVCKGAQSTLYGSDAVAGVINIITVKKEVTKPVNVKATLGLGNQNTTKTNLQVFGKAGKFTYTTRFSKLNTSGFSAAYDSTGNKNYDNDGYNGDMINASVQYQATKSLAVRSFIQHSQYKADVDASGFTDKRNYFINNKVLNSGLGFNYNKKGIVLVGNYQYGELKRLYDDNASYPGATSYSLNDYNGRTQYAELYTNVKLGKGFSVLGGVDYRWAIMNNTFRSVSVFGPYNSKFNDTAMDQKSAYASLVYNSKGFNVEIGGRYNKHSKYGDISTFTFNPSFNIDEHNRMFTSVSSGFKAPSLYQLYAGGGTGNPNLDPEKSTNYELGFQQLYKQFSHRLVGFHRIIDNGIDYDNVNFKYFNYVKQKVTGLEYEVTVQATKALTITANYTYIRVDETTQSRITAKDTAYTYALRRPQHAINLSMGYQFTPQLYVSVRGQSVGKRYDVGGYRRADVSLDGYFILSAYAEYKWKQNTKLFINAQNLTDKKFYEIRGYNSIPLMVNGGITFEL
jgi:vitamin B12 transporter